MVIVQIEGVGTFRGPAALVEEVLEVNRDDGADVYIVTAMGTWAPGIDVWYLWERNT